MASKKEKDLLVCVDKRKNGFRSARNDPALRTRVILRARALVLLDHVAFAFGQWCSVCARVSAALLSRLTDGAESPTALADFSGLPISPSPATGLACVRSACTAVQPQIIAVRDVADRVRTEVSLSPASAVGSEVRVALPRPAPSIAGVQAMPVTGVLHARLLGCAPNPFGKATAINYQLGSAGSVELTLHDATGRAVRRLAGGPQLAGFHSVAWDGKDDKGRVLPAGVYFCRMQACGVAESKRVTLVR